MTLRPAVILATIFFCVYGALAVTVNVPKAAYGFKSDEATYYMIGLSLVHDGDLEYRKDDLVRVWREFPGGPAGVCCCACWKNVTAVTTNQTMKNAM